MSSSVIIVAILLVSSIALVVAGWAFLVWIAAMIWRRIFTRMAQKSAQRGVVIDVEREQQQRPRGVAIYLYWLCLAGTFSPLPLLLPSTWSRGWGNAIFALFNMIVALVGIYIAWGLWTRKPWAYWAVYGLEGIQLVEVGVSLFRLPANYLSLKPTLTFITNTCSLVCSIGIIVAVFLYFALNRKVRFLYYHPLSSLKRA